MESMSSIRSEIEDHLSSSGYTLTTFGHLSGMNRGSLSAILHGTPPKPIAIRQLDIITETLGYPEGWFYHLYLDECFAGTKVSRRRLEPYLIRCAELNKEECLKAAIVRLLETPKPIGILFDIGEKLYQKGRIAESALFHEAVAEMEKDSHSERLAISQYRLFMGKQGPDAEENWKAVIRFEPFRKRLPENHQLDALLKLANVCFTLHKWKEVEKYSDELRALAQAVYREQLRRKVREKSCEVLDTERHLVVYYGQGYLLKTVALQKQDLYDKAKKYVTGYADLSWFENLNEIGWMEVKKFKVWARANAYTLEMLTGNIDILPDYCQFLQDHPEEILPGLLTIVESANKYGFYADPVIEQCSQVIQKLNNQNPIEVDRHYSYRYQLSIYHFRKNQYIEGIAHILVALKLAYLQNNDRDVIQSVTLFEAYRAHASEQQKREYQLLMEEIRSKEKGYPTVGRRYHFA
ncbi:DNA-binding protein [Paenibacillus sp. YPG26]|uniref:DNA-binding protein n=1 Tax=Paenibacillus sp. YPG26 TaxID=2878915 RepID=UPI00203A5B95|nr:DNA-binding protein [Paenibacillus sp. YPG26]USB33805.1 DNA-binding protein [Paenibacillus sp. YPG26]